MEGQRNQLEMHGVCCAKSKKLSFVSDTGSHVFWQNPWNSSKLNWSLYVWKIPGASQKPAFWSFISLWLYPKPCNVNFQKLLLWDGAYFSIFHWWPAPGLSLASRPHWKWWDAHPKPQSQGTLQFPSIWWNPASVTWTSLRYLLKEDSHMKWSPFAPDEVILDQTAVSQAPNVTEHRTSAQQSFLSDPQLITDNMGGPIHLHKDRLTDSQSCCQYQTLIVSKLLLRNNH